MQSKQKTRRLVESALMLAVALVLSSDLLKFGGIWAFGGGVTPCSMVPLVLISFRWGWKWGSFTGFVYSLLQLIQGIDNVQYATGFGMAVAIVLLDYVIAYTVVGFAGIFNGKLKNRNAAIILGVVLCLTVRLACHFLSGWLIWDALWPNEFGMAAPLYSICYNGSYMVPEIILTAAASCLIMPLLDKITAKEKA